MKQKCKGKNREGWPCGKWPIKGGAVCASHGGAAGQVKAAAARRESEAAAAAELSKAMATLGQPAGDIDPAKALLDEIAWTHAHVQWLRSKVQSLTSEGLVWGKSQTDQGIGPQGPVDTKTEKSGPNVWYQMYLTEREHLVKVTTAALRAGIEERRVKLAEQQGDLVAAVVNRILAALNLTPEQAAQVPIIVPREFRALAELG